MSNKDEMFSNNKEPLKGGDGVTITLALAGVTGGAGVGAFVGGTFLGPIGAVVGMKVGSTAGIFAGMAAIFTYESTIGKIAEDHIWVENDYTEDIAIAIHYYYGSEWKTHHWVKVPCKEKLKIAKLRLGSRYIYIHAESRDGFLWGNGELQRTIDGSMRKFTKYDCGLFRGSYTIRIAK